jgi:hypothetical protein
MGARIGKSRAAGPVAARGMTQIAPILLICNKTTRIKLVSNVAAGAD